MKNEKPKITILYKVLVGRMAFYVRGARATTTSDDGMLAMLQRTFGSKGNYNNEMRKKTRSWKISVQKL